MDAITVLSTRVSVGKVKPDPVPRELIEQVLAAGAQAPNHFQVRPWRFTVFTGAGREKFGAAMAAAVARQKPETPAEGLAAEHAKALRAPVIIAIGVDKPAEPKVREIENIAAAAAAAQNMLLAAHALGLAAIWRTGPPAYTPEVKAACGLAPEQDLIATIYLGYPVTEPAAPQRPGFADRTTWVE